MSTSPERQPFENLVIPETQWLVVFKRVVLAVVAVHLVVGAVSSYRAWFQVHSVEITTNVKASPRVASGDPEMNAFGVTLVFQGCRLHVSSPIPGLLMYT